MGRVQNLAKEAFSARYHLHYHPHNAHHKKHLVADLILVTLLVGLVFFSSYLFLFYSERLLHQGINFTITPIVEQAKSGEVLDTLLHIENNTGQPLFDTYLEFPKGLEYIVSATTPKILEGNMVQLGTLDPGEEVDLTVSGYVLAEIDSSVLLTAIFHYSTNPYIGSNEKLLSESIEVYGSSLAVEIELPESLVANQPFDFTVNYQNQSPATNFEKVTILPNWPPGWEIIETDLKLEEAVEYWQIESVGSLESGSISGRARLITTDLDEANISLDLFAAPFGKPLLQDHQEFVIPVHYPNVQASISSFPGIVSLGDTIEYEFSVENREDFTLKNIYARLSINRAIFDASSYPAALDQDNKVLVKLFGTVQPGSTLSYTQSLRVRSQINPLLAFGQGDVELILRSELLYEDEFGQQVILPITPQITKINSDLAGQAFARYFSAEGDQIGRGPIHPTVGETSKYWAFIHLTNQFHALTNVYVSGRLPEGVDLTGRESVTEGKALNFNPATRFIQWSVGSLLDYKTDFAGRSIGAAFEVAITPTSEQVGDEIDLITSIEIQGRDSVTGQVILIRLPNITTSLLNDAYVTNNGEVSF